VAPRVVRVVPDVPAIEKEFDYLVPEHLGDQVRVGTLVRVSLHGRRVGAWVVEEDVESPAGVHLQPIAKVTGWGPAPAVIDVARWAAWRWSGPLPLLLRTASPPLAVTGLPPAEGPASAAEGPPSELATDALAGPRSVVRLPPGGDALAVVVAAARRGPALVLAPSVGEAGVIALRLRRAGTPVAVMPREWARAAAGGRTVVGARAAAWAPVPDLAAVVVVDAHEEVYAEERTPTWNAWQVAAERARRADVPCVLVSACPTLEMLDWGRLVAPSRTDERAGWPIVDVVDRRRDDPRSGMFSPRLVDALRSDRRVVCVLNRTGRARLLACAACGELARCEVCEAAVQQDADELGCRRCGAVRPVVCAACGATRLKTLRAGVTRVREELEALAGVAVGEVTATSDDVPDTRVLVGTEAVLRRVDRADVVAFLELDQELLAPRYRAAEQAMALLARAASVVGGRATGGRLLLQTRLPRHEVIDAALHADPGRLAAIERARRAALRFPPSSALALVAGEAAAAFVAAVPSSVERLGPSDGRWLLRAADHRTLCDALAATPRPQGRLRVEVDPVRA
jgi:primosomal protein N' (replication factor Y)